MRILGIDPGYATIGFGIVEAERGNYHLVQFGTITTSLNDPPKMVYRSTYPLTL